MIWRHRFDFSCNIFQHDCLCTVPSSGNHHSKIPLIYQVDASRSQPSGNQAVRNGGNAAALKVAVHPGLI
jgi:hypothetical protein